MSQYSISSSYDQDWTFGEFLCKQLEIKYSINRRKNIAKNNKIHSKSNFLITNKIGIKKFGEYIYQNYENDHIGFDRKYQKFNLIKNSMFITKFIHKYKGITFQKTFNNWVLRICINGKRKYFGVFNTEEEAFIKKQKIIKDLKLV